MMKGRALTLRPPPFVPPRKGEGSGRLILHAIPFPRLRLAGDDTKLPAQCQTLSVMAGLVPAIPILGAPRFPIGITGTRPVMTSSGCHFASSADRPERSGGSGRSPAEGQLC